MTALTMSTASFTFSAWPEMVSLRGRWSGKFWSIWHSVCGWHYGGVVVLVVVVSADRSTKQ